MIMNWGCVDDDRMYVGVEVSGGNGGVSITVTLLVVGVVKV